MKKIEDYMACKQCYPDLDEKAAVTHLSKLLTFETVSYADQSQMKKSEFEALHAYLVTAFPLVHQAMTREVIGGMSLLYHWKGKTAEKGTLFMAHLDVVPVNEETLEEWKYPPFSGTVAEGSFWSRGAADTKNSVIGYLSAAEYLLAHGFVPKRDIYFAFGHDEETLGGQGNEAMAKLLASRGVALDFVLDEGGHFTDGQEYGAPGVLLAQVDIFEKGYVNIEVSAESRGGHSSQPGSGTSLGKVCRALAKIEEAAFPPTLNPVVRSFLTAVAPHVTEQPYQTWFADLAHHEQEILDFFMADAARDPLVHTTTAVNMLTGGSPAANVLPQKVKGLINFRTAPGDLCEAVCAHCVEAAADCGVQITVERGVNPSGIASLEGLGYRAVRETLAQMIPEAVLVPGLITGGTDARFYEQICNCCLRFKPYLQLPHSAGNAHRVNENSPVAAHLYGIRFFIALMEKFC